MYPLDVGPVEGKRSCPVTPARSPSRRPARAILGTRCDLEGLTAATFQQQLAAAVQFVGATRVASLDFPNDSKVSRLLQVAAVEIEAFPACTIAP